MSLRLWLLGVHRYHCYSYCQTSKCDCGDYVRDDKEHIIVDNHNIDDNCCHDPRQTRGGG